MLTIALLVIPLEFVAFIAIGWVWGAVSPGRFSGLGGVSAFGQTAAILGILSSAIVFSALIAGLNKEPEKKGSGALACLMVLVIVLIQAIYFSPWIKYG